MRQPSPRPDSRRPPEGPGNGGFTATAPILCPVEGASEVIPGASHVILRSLETENELLKSELRAQHLLVADLQTRFSSAEVQRRRQASSLCHDAVAGLEQRVAEAAAELQRKEELVAYLTQHSAALQAELHTVQAAAQGRALAAARQAEALQRVCRSTAQCLSQWLTFVEELLLQVLPTFRAMVAPEGGGSLQALLQTYALEAPIAHLPPPAADGAIYATDEQRVAELLRSMDGALAMLQQVVFARLETMLILRTKLADDTTRLQRELEALAADRQRCQAEAAAGQREVEAERAATRRDLAELRELYRRQLAGVEQQRQAAVQRAEAAEAELQALAARCAELQGAAERSTAQRREAERRLGAEETTRARLIVEMQALKREADLRAEELSCLRAQQKLLALPGGGGGGPTAKPEGQLLRMLEQLLAENEALRNKQAQLAVDMAVAAGQAAQAKYLPPEAREARELALVAERRVPDALLTARILQRNLHASGPGPGPDPSAGPGAAAVAGPT